MDKIKNLLDEDTVKKIEDLNSSYIDIQEIANYFSSLMNEEFDISSLEKIEERIESYKRISRKHNINENSLLDFKKNMLYFTRDIFGTKPLYFSETTAACIPRSKAISK